MLNQLARMALYFLSGIVTIALLLLFVPQWQKHRTLEQRLQKQDIERSELNAKLNDYRLRQQRFQTEPAYVEQVAYEIGMAKADQMLFRFYDDQDTYEINAN